MKLSAYVKRAIIIFSSTVLVGCNIRITPTSKIQSTDLPTGTLALNPSSTLIPTQTVSPSATLTVTHSINQFPSIVTVNIDGFACAAAMSINLLMPDHQAEGSFREVLCDDFSDSMHSTAMNFGTISEWFIFNVGTFLRDNDLLISIYYEGSLKYDDLLKNLEKDKVSIAVVQTPGFLHAIVIVGYDPNGHGYLFLESLHEIDTTLPGENDFKEYFGISFKDAWQFTFVMDYVGEK